jgi:hypothetical protein
MLSSRLWPENYTYNPLTIYFTMGRKGRLAEWFLGGSPWLAVVLMNFGLLTMLVRTGSTDSLIHWLSLELVLLPFFASMISAMGVTRQFRQVAHRIPFEQILLTKISRREILHAVLIRPLSIQAVSQLLAVIAHLPMLLYAWHGPMQRLYQMDAVVCVVAIVVGYFLAGACSEVAGCLMLRAHLYIRSPWVARTRFCIDWLVSPLGFGAVLILFLNFMAVVGIHTGAALFFFLLLLSATSDRTERSGGDILDDCSRYAEDWHVLRPGEHEIKLPWLRKSWGDLLRALSHSHNARHQTGPGVFVRPDPSAQ